MTKVLSIVAVSDFQPSGLIKVIIFPYSGLSLVIDILGLNNNPKLDFFSLSVRILEC